MLKRDRSQTKHLASILKSFQKLLSLSALNAILKNITTHKRFTTRMVRSRSRSSLSIRMLMCQINTNAT